MKSMFITLEGIEGSGKSSSLETINNYLSKSEICYINTREPGGSDLGKKLRSILLDTKSILSPQVELLLMLADRKDHIERVIMPNLKKGLCVVSDRFMDSSIAYQGGGRELNIKSIKLMTKELNFPKPNLTILFDLPVEISLERAKKRGNLDRFEQEDLDFHNRIRETYLKLANEEPHRIKVVDSSKTFDEVQDKIIGILEDFNERI